MSALENKALTQRQLHAIVSDYIIKERIQLAYPRNYEVAEVPIDLLCKAINKLQRKKFRGEILNIDMAGW